MTDRPQKALTVHDPWADAIVYGDKRIENRTWTPYSGSLGNRILIHTAKAWDEEHAERAAGLEYMGLHAYDEDRAARGHIIGSVRVVGYIHEQYTEREHELVVDYINDQFPAGVYLADALRSLLHGLLNDPWWQGPVGWILDDPVAYETPVAARGQQRIWTPDDDALKRCWAQEDNHADI
ncbi:MAG: ASCH domain-containing protein [Trueperaceae bacterium]|nr:ASCH domain-containing protein [Trueperaceae bacterium]